jgi:hypothetical protein
MRRPKFTRYGFPPDQPEWPYELPDPEDAPFLSIAYAARACLVTGNIKHFPEKMRNSVEVLTPAQYLEHLVNRAEAPNPPASRTPLSSSDTV